MHILLQLHILQLVLASVLSVVVALVAISHGSCSISINRSTTACITTPTHTLTSLSFTTYVSSCNQGSSRNINLSSSISSNSSITSGGTNSAVAAYTISSATIATTTATTNYSIYRLL